MNTRLSISVEPDLAERITELKRVEFYDSSWAELYRFLLAKALDAYDAENKRKQKCAMKNS